MGSETMSEQPYSYPKSSETRYHQAIRNPVDPLLAMREPEAKKNLCVTFSQTRGGIHALLPPGCDGFNEDAQFWVVANGGAQLMNSPHYHGRKGDPNMLNVVIENERAVAPTMLAYTRPTDVLVTHASDSNLQGEILHQLSDSWRGIGIDTTRQYEFVKSIDDWVAKHAGKVPIIPNVLSPEVITGYGGTHAEALAHVAAYTKDGAQQLWERDGIHTPATYYHEHRSGKPAELPDDFRRYSDLVVNRTDGSGGYGISFVSAQDLDFHMNGLVEGTYQIQGKLPVLTSPCLIANISGEKASTEFVSIQRFSQPGVHAGNVWHRKLPGTLSYLDPDFMAINQRALDSLRLSGVRGQVNVDSIVVDPRNAATFDVPPTTMREANIRPAGSSVMLRAAQGTINGLPIDSMRTVTGVHLPFDRFMSGQFTEHLSSFDGPSNRTLVYNYNPVTEKAAIAFAGACPPGELRRLEREVIGSL